MASEVKLVMEIEKYDCLYNYKLAEYARKDVTERAWGEVAKKTNISVNDCKEKWRNIRSSFIRSMKAPPSGSKAKKPYYLKEYLQFICPYVKPQSQTSGNIPSPETQTRTVSANSQVNDSYDEESENLESSIENEEALKIPALTTAEPQSIASQHHTIASSTPSQSQLPSTFGRRNKRPIPEVEKTFINYLQNKTKRRQTDQTIHSNNKDQPITASTPMQYFFMSLLPEFESMSDNEIRSFKIKVLTLIDDIKTKHSQHIPDSAPSTVTSIPYRRTSFEQASVHSPISPSHSYQISNNFSPIHYNIDSSAPHIEQFTTLKNVESNNIVIEENDTNHSYLSDF